MDTTTTKPWDDGLTPEQAAMVETAARAGWEADGMSLHWSGLSDWAKGRRLRDVVAALRAIGHLPAPKVQTRGEAVAEMVVTLTCYRFHFHSPPDGATGQVMPDEPSTEHLRWVRQYIADWIDAERQAARDEALDEALGRR